MPSESYPNQKHYSGSNQDDKFEGHDPSNNPFSFKHPWDDAMFLNYSDKEKHAIKNAIKSDETMIVDTMVDKEEGIWPMLPPSSSLKEIIMGNVVFKQTWQDVLAKRQK